MLTGEHPPGPAETGSHLIRNHQQAMEIAQFPHPCKKTGRLYDHAAGTLQEWFDHQTGTAGAMLDKQGFQGVKTLHSAGGWISTAQLTAVTVGRRGLDCFKQQRAEGAVIDIDAPHADRTQGIAMIGVSKGDKARALRPAPMHLVLKGHLDCHFHGCRTVVGIKDPVKSDWRDLRQATGQ